MYIMNMYLLYGCFQLGWVIGSHVQDLVLIDIYV